MAAEYIDDTETGSGVYPTKIPGYEDAADIQEALRLYHYGTSTIPSTTSEINTKSVAGYLKALSDIDVANALIAANAVATETSNRTDADSNLQSQINNLSATVGLQTTIISKTSNFALTIPDAGKTILMNTASSMTLTVPSNSSVPIPVGYQYFIIEAGTGRTTFTPASGVTINSKNAQMYIDTQSVSYTHLTLPTNREV